MKKIIVIILAIFMVSGSMYSQRTCAAQDLLNQRIESDSRVAQIVREYLEKLNTWLNNHPYNPVLHRSPITIPVVVHVLYNTSAQNISTAQINSQITALNTDFRKRNTALIRTIPTPFRTLAADALIQFELAKRDPAGNATTGITRTSTTNAFFNYQQDNVKKASMGGVAPWNTNDYLNIWVCELRNTAAGGGAGLLGYATFPEDTAAIHGVVIRNTAFGTTGTASSPFDKGHTTSHEVGHFFGLRHIWGDANCGDDFVADTPTQQTDNTGCPTYPQVTCSNGPNGDMFMNYMDYVHDTCMNMFTNGQRARMLANLAPGFSRASLAVSMGLFPPNSTTITHSGVYLTPENESLPSWKAALVMVHGWACQCSPSLPTVLQQNSAYCSSRRTNFGVSGTEEVSDHICALALNVEEILMCYSAQGFYNILRDNGPIALLSLQSGSFYGLVVKGMVIDPSGRAYLSILDPMNIGPRNFGLPAQSGSEYTVSYSDFMLNNLEALARSGKKIFMVTPPRQAIP